MRHSRHLVSLLALLLGLALASGPPAAAQTAGSDLDARVEALLARMTVEEKVGQMTQLTLQGVSATQEGPGSRHGFDERKLRRAVVDYGVGSILNVWDAALSLPRWQQAITRIQDLATRETRLGIPVLYGIDAVHGHTYLLEGTVFPHHLGLAATWDPEVARRTYEVAAREMRASGMAWNFAPMLDVGRHPLWSRFAETFGEDVHLTTMMGRAALAGLQGDGDLAARGRVAGCAKHFLGLSFPLSGKDRTPAWIPERMLREIFLPPFRAAVEGGVASVMVNTNEINGVPVHSNRRIVTDLLRGELGFEGVAVSDWEDVWRLHTVHRVAPDLKSAVAMAIEAGIDMSMVPYDLRFADLLLELVREGAVSEARLDESVRRILRLKMRLGLFENPYPDPALAAEVGSEEARALSFEAAKQAVVLLDNKRGVLPLSRGTRLLVTGPAATSLPMLHGSWTYTWQGREESFYPRTSRTLLDALREELGAAQVTHVPGATADRPLDVEAAARAARAADVVVLALGEPPSSEKPGDIEDLALPAAQLALARAVLASGKPVVLVLLVNRPRVLEDIPDRSAAVVFASHPGMYGGEALADVLSGDAEPGGRLPFTWPRHTGSLVPYDHKVSDRQDKGFGENAFNPLFEFGSGLSYTTFAYSGLRLAPSLLLPGETVTATVTVTNTGRREGSEVVQVYVRDLYASVTPPVRRLRAFEKVTLAPGESRTLSFALGPQAMSFIGRENRPVLEPGEFRVEVGGLAAGFVVR